MEEIGSYPEKLQVLNGIIKAGIKELCEFAKKNNYLQYPYGRNPDPTPLITEEQFVAVGGLKCDDDEPLFQYEYGFDSLKFLSDYLLWAHPDAVKQRENDKLAAQERLNFRANHAVRQLHTQDYLTQLIHCMESGIEWGPFVVPLNMNSVRCVLKPYKSGVIYVQLSTEKDFQSILKTYKIYHYPPSSSVDQSSSSSSSWNLTGHLLSSKVFDLPNLQEKKSYYIRSAAIPWDDATMTIDAKFHSSMLEMKESDGEKYLEEIAFATELLSRYANVNRFWTIPDPTFSLFTSHSPVLADYSVHHSFPYDRQSLLKLQFFGQLPLTFLQNRWPKTIPKSTSTLSADLAPLTNEEKDDLALDIGNNTSSTGLLPLYTCFLGDIFEHNFYEQLETLQQQMSYSSSLEDLILQYYGTQLYYFLNNISEHTTINSPPLRKLLEDGNMDNLFKSFQSSLLIAWRDSNPQSSSLLKWEESIYKQYRHDFKKYQKKYGLEDDKKKKGGGGGGKPSKPPLASSSAGSTHVPPAPVLKRPPISPQLQALLQGFPLIHAYDLPPAPPAPSTNSRHKVKPDPSVVPLRTILPDQDSPQSCRMLYRSIMISGDVQLIILDSRRMQGKISLGCDYLGKEQAEWLQYILQSSTATWKIICTGKAFGVCAEDTVTTMIEEPPRTEAITLEEAPNPEGTSSDHSLIANPSEEMIVVKSGSYETIQSDGNAAELFIGSNDDASINAEVNQAPRKESLKPVQFLIPQSKTDTPTNNNTNTRKGMDVSHHYENHTNLYEDCDEHYGRSKYSLQYILADYELKVKENNSSEASVTNNEKGSAPGTAGAGTTANTTNQHSYTPIPIQDLNGKNTFHHIASQTGIIILSSGIATHWTNEEEITLSHSPSVPKTPTTPSQQRSENNEKEKGAAIFTKTTNIGSISDVLLPSYCAAYYNLSSPIVQTFPLIQNTSNQPLSSHRGHPAFCIEIGLGSVTESSQQVYQEMQVERGGDYHYLMGLDAFTYYSQPLQGEGDDDVNENSYSFCEFFLLPDSAIKISVYSSSLPTEGQEVAKKLLYECICTVQSHDADDQSDGSVFMV